MIFDDVEKLKQSKPTGYNLEYYERDSISEIKKIIAQKGYKNRQQIESHMQFLENLADKLKDKISLQKGLGEVSWGLERDFEDVKQLFSILGNLIE